MEMDSKEYREVLKDYQSRNKVIGLAIKLLLATEEEEIKKIHDNANMTNIQLNELVKIMSEISKNIIEEG